MFAACFESCLGSIFARRACFECIPQDADIVNVRTSLFSSSLH